MATSKATRATTTKKPKSPGLISEEVETALHLAFVDARERHHEFISVEHLLFGLVDTPSAKDVLVNCGADLDELKSRIGLFIDENSPVVEKEDVDTQPTLGFQRVVQRAIMQVQSSGQEGRQVTGSDLLLGIFGEKDSHAVYYLHQQGVTRLDILNYLRDGLKKSASGARLASTEKEKVNRDVATILTEATQPFVNVAVKKSERPKLFISYSHVDTACVDRLLVHLKPLERSNTIICWSDKRLGTGDKWKAEIEQNLNDAVIAVLLISADFLASDFIVNNELPPLLIKADSKGLKILPVIVKPCGFRRDPVLSTFQAANDPATPLLGMTAIEQEAVYDKIAEEIAKEISAKRAS
jgi:hypothetical protein